MNRFTFGNTSRSSTDGPDSRPSCARASVWDGASDGEVKGWENRTRTIVVGTSAPGVLPKLAIELDYLSVYRLVPFLMFANSPAAAELRVQLFILVIRRPISASGWNH